MGCDSVRIERGHSVHLLTILPMGIMSKPVINVTQRLADHAAATPDRPAMIIGSHRIRFGEFDAATDAAAAYFARQGMACGDVLPLLLTHQIAIATAFMAAMRMGATPMVLSPGLTDRLRGDIVRQAGDVTGRHRT